METGHHTHTHTHTRTPQEEEKVRQTSAAVVSCRARTLLYSAPGLSSALPPYTRSDTCALLKDPLTFMPGLLRLFCENTGKSDILPLSATTQTHTHTRTNARTNARTNKHTQKHNQAGSTTEEKRASRVQVGWCADGARNAWIVILCFAHIFLSRRRYPPKHCPEFCCLE